MSNFFSGRLKSARELRGWSQAELAERAKLQATAISHFETGTRSPSFDNLKRLADALSVTTDYLMGRSEEPGLSGPTADQLFRDAEKLTDDDLQTLQKMAGLLAAKNSKSKPQ